MGSLSTLVPSRERALVCAKAARLHAEAEARAEPGVSPRLRHTTCFVVAAIAPQLLDKRLSLLTRHALWSFVLDDRLDRPGADPDPTADAVTEVAIGHRTGHRDPLLIDLARTLDDLSTYDDPSGLFARFVGALLDAVDAEVRQVAYSRSVATGAVPPPTVEQYLELAAQTVNYRSFAYALLAVRGAPPRESLLDPIDAALWVGARAVRLGNDLRSVARDRSSAALNVLNLCTPDGARVTPHDVSELIDHYVGQHDQMLAMLPEPDPAVPALRRCLRVSVGIYRLTDLR